MGAIRIKGRPMASASTSAAAEVAPAPRRRAKKARSAGPEGQGDGVDASESPSLPDDVSKRVSGTLLAWYDRNHRVLPWRRNPHSKREGGEGGGEGGARSAADFAYAVWVSEVMLQQTQVQTVVGYFERWMARWPTVAALAAADIEDVNAVWAGLGYYRRARFLLEGARHVCTKLNGQLPATREALASIPGIGAYTASAIASIAFGSPVGVVDGNVVRVISRLRALGANPTTAASKRTLQGMADTLASGSGRPGCLNQALMELGATVCKPTAPACTACPVRSDCVAREMESKGGAAVTTFPAKVARKPPKEEAVRMAVCIVVPPASEGGKGEEGRKGGKGGKGGGGPMALLVRRPEGGLLGGMWELPTVAGGSGKDASEAMAALLAARGGDAAPVHAWVRLGKFTHVFSHVRQHVVVDRVGLVLKEGGEGGLGEGARLVSLSDPDALKGLTAGVRKALGLHFQHERGIGKFFSVGGGGVGGEKGKKGKKGKGKVEVKGEGGGVVL